MPDQLPRVITRATALALGLSDVAIRIHIASYRWCRLHTGVYFTRSAEPLPKDLLLGAVLRAGEGAALSGAAALTQWGLRDVSLPTRPLILVPHSSSVGPTGAIRIRRTSVPYLTSQRDDIPTVEIARAVADHRVEVPRLATVQGIASEVIRRGFCTVTQLQLADKASPQRGFG
jgi:hypothetical protein